MATARVHCQVKSGPVSRPNRAPVRLCAPYLLERTRTTSTDAPRSPSMLAPSQQKDQTNQTNPDKSRKTKEKPFGPWPSLPSAVFNKVDASRRAEKCRSLRVKVEVGVSGCRIAGVGPALKTRPRLPPAPGLPSAQDSPPYGTLSRVKE
jgi:hypothetical protein